MKKLQAVEDAREVMTLGLDWGVFKWLFEKPRVRKIADRATEALNSAEDKVKATWSDDLKRAYNLLATDDGESGNGKKAAKGKNAANGIDPDLLSIAKAVYDLDVETETMRLDAEDTFAEGEKKLSVAMARDGARKALATYDLHESAIRKAEAAGKKK